MDGHICAPCMVAEETLNTHETPQVEPVVLNEKASETGTPTQALESSQERRYPA